MEMKLLAFDCDGTLLDTREDYRDAIAHTLRAWGLTEITLQQATDFLGYGTDHLVTESLKAVDADLSIFDRFKEEYLDYYYHHLCIKTHPYPGIPAFLSAAQQLGFTLAVISNKPDRAVKELIAHSFPQIRFATIRGQGVNDRPKPYPDLMKSVLNDLSFTPAETAYFGDTEVDAMFAHNAGIEKLFLVTYGFRPSYLLKQKIRDLNIHPTAYLDTTAELNSLLPKLK